MMRMYFWLLVLQKRIESKLPSQKIADFGFRRGEFDERPGAYIKVCEEP